jgi:hypothetical protein
LFDDELGVLIHELVELLIVGRVLGKHLELIGRNVAGDRLAVFSALEIVIGAVWALANDTEFAWLHVLDLGDLLEYLSGIKVFHGESIYICIYYTTKKNTLERFSLLASCAPAKTQ